ncbi:MAG: 50S ribosomal protein L25 [Parcubacteria group bacterium]|nr:50S ribosomal protein L25 [Parcubacteria group bacterium]
MKLDAKIREKGGVNQLRKSGMVPGVVYGRGVENMAVAVGAAVLDKTLKEAGESTLLELVMENGNSKHVLIHDLQRDPVKDFPIHVDFLEVRLDQKIKAGVVLEFIGAAPAVIKLGGVLVKNMHELEVEALPQDLPHNIEVDISALKNFEDHITVGDVKVGPKIKILSPRETIVALVVPPRSEAELEELKAEVTEDVSKVEGVVKEEVAPESAPESVKKEAGEETGKQR